MSSPDSDSTKRSSDQPLADSGPDRSSTNPTISDAQTPAAKPRIGRSVAIALGLMALAAIGWFGVDQVRFSAETKAGSALKEMGALVGMDANRKHVFSLNLTLPGVLDKFDAAIEQLPKLYRLENLELSRSPVRDAQLANVTGLSCLTSLQLNTTEVSDQGIQHLTGLNSLQAIHLVHTKITSAGLPTIAKLSTLKILNLSENSLDGDFAPLKNLDQLEHLLLSEIELSDEAMATFGQLESLSRLTIIGSKVSDEAVDKLKQAKLGIQIDQ